MTDSSQSQQSSSLSFTQGFILGQISIVVLIFFFIKFFIFGESPSSNDYHLRHHARSTRAVSFSGGTNPYLKSAAKAKASSVLRYTGPVTTAAILSKTYYNVRNHQPESVDWFNVLIAQTIAQLRNDAQQDNAILTSITDLLNGDRKPDFLDEIKVTELSLGEEFPVFSNCRIIPVDNPSSTGAASLYPSHDGPQRSRPTSSAGGPDGAFRLQARMDVDLSDAITLGIETKLVLNYPKPLVAVMPVALAVTVVRFSGTLSISFIPSPPSSSSSSTTYQDASATEMGADPAPKSAPTALTFSFDPSYRLELSTHSLLGSRSRLQDIPKIAQLIESRLHAWFDERCVEPRFQRVVLPSLWPRRGNVGTRGENGFEGDADTSLDRNMAGAEATPRPDDTGEVLKSMRDRLTADGLRWRKERDARYADEEDNDDWDTEGINMPRSMPGALPD